MACSWGMYKSSDAGVNWSLSAGGHFCDVKFKPGNPSVVYASMRNGDGFYKSTDAGTSYLKITSGLPASGWDRTLIGISDNNPSVVYILFSNSTGAFYGMYKSTDGGASFSFTANSPNLLNNQGWYDIAFVISPTNENEMYVGGPDMWKSFDGGITFTKCGGNYGTNTPFDKTIHGDHHKFIITNSGTFFVASDGGIYRSYDKTLNWVNLNEDLNNTQLYRIGDYEYDDKLMIAGLQDNGAYILNNSVWKISMLSDGMECFIDQNNPNISFFSWQNGGLLRSTDGGETYSVITPSGQSDGSWITPFLMHPKNSSVIYSGYKDVYKSTNAGTSWTAISSGLTSGVNLEYIEVDNSGNNIYAATTKNIWKTNTAGANWSNINGTLPLTNAFISRIYCNPSNPQNVWVTIGGYTAGEKVYASVNGGNSWTNISGTLPNIPANCIVLDQNNTDQAMYLGTDLGVYYIDNNSNGWQPFNTGLPNVRISDLEIHYGSGKLRAATYGRGLWETNIPTSLTPPSPLPCSETLNHPTIDHSSSTVFSINGYNGSNENAELFTPDGSYTHVSGAAFKFSSAQTNNPSTSKIIIKMWKNDGPNGAPGTIIAQKDLLISQIITDVTNNTRTEVIFNSSVAATTPYYLGYEISAVSGDAVGIKSTWYDATPTNTAWYKANNVWNVYSWKLSMYAYSIIGNVPTVDFTVNSTSACPGNTLNFTNNSTKANAFKWTITGSTPDSSYAINPTVVYNTGGIYNVKLVAYGTCNGKDSLTKTNYITIGTPSLSSVNTNVSCNGGSNGAINLSVSGAGTFTYLWSSGATTQDISNLGQGNYSVTVSSGGCNSTATYSITQPAVLSSSSTSVNVNCNGGNTGSIDLTVTGGTSPYLYMWSNGTLTQDITGLTATTYTVTVTDSKGCSTTYSKTISQPQVLTAVTSVTNASCGSSNGAVDLTPGGGTGPYTFNWNNNANTEDLSNLGAGTFSVTLTDNKACSKTASVTLISPGSPAITLSSVTQVSCNGGSNGAIDITPGGGATPYSYNWSNGATTQDVSGLAAGTYTVTVSDVTSCSYNTSINITQPQAMTVSVANQTNVSCNGGSNGSVTLSINGGISPFTYNWSNGAISKDIVNLVEGTFSVTVSSAGGCTSTTSATISQPSPFISSIKTNAPASCNGGNDGAVDINVSGGVSPITYSWNNGASTQDITGLTAGTYNVTATDKNGCTSSLSAAVIQPLVLAAIISGKTNISCYGANNGSIDLSANGGTSPYSYVWNNNAVTQDISGLSASPFAVTVTDSKNCKAYISTIITQPDSINIVVTSQTNVSCAQGNNGSIDITVSGGLTPYSYLWSNGIAVEDPTGLSASTYTVTVTAGSGCIKSKNVILTQPAAIAVSENSFSNISCNGGNNGAIDVNVNGGTFPYTYLWNYGATSQDVSGLGAGTFTVTVTGTGGCSSVFSKTLTQPQALSTSTSITNVTCGSNNGSVDLSVSGGNSPYSYNWNSGAITQDISSLAAGEYSVTITDANNCLTTKTATVTQPGALNIAITGVTNVSCNGGSNGGINITVSGGTSPFTYAWSNASTTEDISSLAAGTYSVTVTDFTSCSYTTSANVIQPAVLAASVTSQTNVSCNGGSNGAFDLTVSGGNSPYTYSWSNASSNQDPTGLAAGVYTVTVTSTGGCTDTSMGTITEPAIISVTSSLTNVSCNGGNNGSVNTSISGGNSPYAFSWSNNATTEDITNLTSGQYLVTITDAFGCTKNASATITQPAAFSAIVASVTDANCNTNANGSINISVSGGTSPFAYLWSNGMTTQDIQNLSSGSYSVTVSDSLNCVATSSAMVNLPPTSSINIVNKKDVSCFGGNNGNIDINASGGIPPYSYNWSNGSTTQDISTLVADTYSIVVTNGGGCSHSLTIVVSQPDSLAASSSQINILCNGSGSGGVNLEISGGITPYTFTWNNGSTTEDINAVLAGTYIVTVKDANNCTVSDTSVISQPSAITINDATTSATCGSNNGAVNVSVSGGITPYTFLWSNGATTEDINSVAAGNYSLSITDGNNCQKLHTATVTQPGTLTAGISKTDISCNGSNNGSINLTPSGGTSPYTYSWSNSVSTEDISNLSPGNYTVTITDNSGCSYITSAKITDPAVLSSNTSVSHVSCYAGNNGTVTAIATGGTTPYSYLWSNGATTSQISNLTSQIYNVTITDANGCTSQNSASVNQPAQFTANVISQINVSCNGANNGSLNLSVAGGTTPYIYSWSNGASVQDPANLVAGTYSVTVTSNAGCNASATATVTQPAAVSVSIKTQSNVACSGGNNGALDINVAGGSSPYSFQWSNSSITEDIIGISSGNYSVTVTDSKGCTGTLTATISQSGNVAISSTVTNVSCNAGNNGGLNVTVSGGASPYSYNWSNAATTEDISGLIAGSYSLTVTDASNCSNTHSASISQPTAVAVTINSQQNVTCNGGNNGSANAIATGGTAPFTYLWSNAQTSASASGLSAGTASLTSTDAVGCTGTGNVTITEPAALIASVSSVTNNTSCGANDGAIDVSVNGGLSPYSYAWNNGTATEDISGLAAGTFSLSATDANGCSDTTLATVTQPGTLGVSLNTLSNATCSGGNDAAIDISVSGGSTPYSFSWSNGASTEDISSLVAGSFTVTVTDAASCNEVQSFTVGQPQPLSSQISVSTAIACNGGAGGVISVAAFGGTTAYSYSWSNGQSSAAATGLSAGSYSVTTTDANSCTSVASFVLTEPSAFSASVLSKSDVSCNGGSNGSVNITVSGGTSPFTYSWSNSASSKNISSLTAATYLVTVTDAAGCTANANATISQPAALNISFVVTDVTANGGSNGAIDLSVTGGYSPYNFIWSNNASSEDLANLQAGSFSVTVTDALSCSDTAIISVTQPASSAYCSGTVNLTALADTFDDGSAASAYGTSADCKWLIQPPNTDYIILSFLDFKTELNGDYVTIYDGADTASPMLASYSGNNLPYAVQSTGGSMLVHFSSNNSVNDSGWTASYQAIALPTTFCSGTTNLTAASGTLSDGSAGSNYNNYSDCRWLIQPTGATSVTFGFTVFATETDYDMIRVYDGVDTTANILAVFSGSNIPDSITSSGGSMLVHFTSDYSVNDAGWDAWYNSSNAPNSFCSGTTNLTAASGSFGDGSGAANYGPNSDCQWLIQPAGANSITLSFSNFDSEQDYDFVDVYDGATTSDSLLGSFSGNTLPANIISSGGTMLVHFTSDYSMQTAGWFASYSSSSAPPSAYCSGTTNLSAASGSFSDGSAAGDYVENSTCSWLIQPAGASFITLSFSSFAVEDGYDYVYVYDGVDTSGTMLAAFTGNNIPSPVTVVGNSMFVLFSSDYIVNDAGWEADYTSGTGTASYCSGTVSLTADSGTFHDGSGPNNYLENADCFWLIQPSGASSITLDFSSSKTELDYDYVLVYDGVDTSAALLGYLTGDSISSFTSTGGSMLVWFYSDNLYNDEGFTASYTSIIPAPVYCSGTTALTAAADSFSDGSAGNDYLENSNCKWLIQPAGANNITLYFDNFDLESGYDFVYVYDGPDTLSALLGAFTGSSLPANVSSSAGSMLVQFMSDYVVNATGWEAHYDTSFTPAVVYCSGTTTLSASSDCFSDGSGTSDYLENSDCKWLIQPAGANSITLSFSSFDTENGWDSLYVYDGATSSDALLGSFTGNSLPADITSSGGSMLVHFVSDYLYNQAGWDACYTSDSAVVSCTISAAIIGTDASCSGCSDGSADLTVSGASGSVSYLWSDFSVTEDLSGLMAGTYYVTVSDSALCSAIDSVVIGEFTGFCSGTTTLTASADCFSDGSDTSDYLLFSDCKWLIQPAAASSITISFSAFATEDGYDSVLVYDGATTAAPLLGGFTGATIPSSVTSSGGSMLVHFISDNLYNDAGWDACYTSATACNITTAVSATDASCNGCVDGAATVSASGGTTPYSYLWSNGQATSTATGLSSGMYYVTVDDAAICTTVDSVFISEPSACNIITSIIGTDATCSGCSDGSADLTVSGASGSVSYLWSDFSVTEDLSGLMAGTYYVTVTDTAGCSAIDSVTISEPAACTISTSITGTDASCSGCSDGSADLTVSGASGSVSYLWSDFSVTEDLSGLMAGTYYVTVTDTAACSAVDSVVIGEFSGFCSGTTTLSASADCFSDGSDTSDYLLFSDCKWLIQPTGASSITLSFSAFATEDGYDSVLVYDGATTAAPLLGGFTGATIPPSVTSTGGSMLVHFISDNLYNDAGWDACYTSGTACNITTAVSATDASCNGCVDGSATVTASGGTTPYSYLWSNGQITVAATGLAAGDYTVTVTDNSTCSAVDSVTINEPAACNIVTSVIGTDASCAGCSDGSANLTVTGANGTVAYLWSNAATTEDISALVAGTYSVTVTDSAGCSAIDSVIIGEPAPVPYCSGTTTLTTPTGNFSDGSAANDYAENSDCKWLIQPSGASSITLTFSAFATEQGYDSVYVFDGATTAAPLLGGFTGSAVPSPVNSSGGSMLVWFLSDNLYNDAGWDASYTITTDITEPGGDVSIAIFPNPNQGVFTYSFKTNNNAEFKADIVNVLGEVIWRDEAKKVKGSYTKEADIRDIPAGVYFLNITVDGRSYITRIVRQ